MEVDDAGISEGVAGVSEVHGACGEGVRERAPKMGEGVRRTRLEPEDGSFSVSGLNLPPSVNPYFSIEMSNGLVGCEVTTGSIDASPLGKKLSCG